MAEKSIFYRCQNCGRFYENKKDAIKCEDIHKELIKKKKEGISSREYNKFFEGKASHFNKGFTFSLIKPWYK